LIKLYLKIFIAAKDVKERSRHSSNPIWSHLNSTELRSYWNGQQTRSSSVQFRRDETRWNKWRERSFRPTVVAG